MKFDLLKQFIRQGPLTVQVTGSCMDGVIPDGSSLRLEENLLYWPGEVIAFKGGADEIVSHRLLGYLPLRNGWFAITRADRAKQADSPVALRHVLGRVTRIDGDLFRPELKDRIHAQAAWFVAVARLLVSRLRRLSAPLDETS